MRISLYEARYATVCVVFKMSPGTPDFANLLENYWKKATGCMDSAIEF